LPVRATARAWSMKSRLRPLWKAHRWYRRWAGLAALTLRLRPEHPRVLAVLMSSFSSVVPIERPRHSFTTAISSSGIDWSTNPNPGSCGLKKRYHAAPTDLSAAAGGPGDLVSRERQVRLAGASSAGARARRPIAWIAGWRETETLKPIDKAIERMVSESPGRNASERELAPKDPNPGGRAVDYPVKATQAVAVWLTRRPAPAGLGATAR